jgi:hypothetical protein
MFGQRWQRPLARAVGYSDRMVRYWATGKWPVADRAASLIAQLVREKHGRRMKIERASYLGMVAALRDGQVKAQLMT